MARTHLNTETFNPFDAHQAKSLLTKNDFLAKLIALFGLHDYILYCKPKQAPPAPESSELNHKDNQGGD